MNVWTIYWILQLDSINAFMVAIMFVFLLATGFALMFGLLESSAGKVAPEMDVSKREAARGAALLAVSKKTAIPAILASIMVAFLPSTKTVAAMVVLPAIANNETIRKESGELYQLAKQALREAATGKDEKAAAK